MGSRVLLPTSGQPQTGPDTSFKSAAIPNLVSFEFQRVAPPTTLYIQRDDTLNVSIRNSVAGQVVELKYRMLLPITPKGGQPDSGARDTVVEQVTPGGTIIVGRTTFTPTSDRTANNFVVQLAEGYLLGLDFSGLAGTQIRGQTYVQCFLARGATTAIQFATQPLCANYLLTQTFLGWPGTSMISALEGPGWVHTVTVANPAAGADWSVAVPANARWRIQSIFSTLTTSAAVANRVPRILIQDTTPTGVWSGPPNQVIPASTSSRVTAAQSSLTAAANIVDTVVILPDPTIMMAGWTLSSSTLNLQAADQYSSIALAVEEWMEN